MILEPAGALAVALYNARVVSDLGEALSRARGIIAGNDLFPEEVTRYLEAMASAGNPGAARVLMAARG